MYYTYVLRSKADNKLYVGFTNDLKKRVLEHNKGTVQATKTRRPMNLIYYEACLDKDKAISREKYFKTGFGRRFLKSKKKGRVGKREEAGPPATTSQARLACRAGR